jgi:diguanylate cyclase (GGDEF)-like protein
MATPGHLSPRGGHARHLGRKVPARSPSPEDAGRLTLAKEPTARPSEPVDDLPLARPASRHWNKLPAASALLRRSTSLAFVLAATLLGLTVTSSYRAALRAADDARTVAQTHMVIATLAQLDAAMREAAIWQRAHLVTGNPGDLDRMTTALTDAQDSLATLHGLAQANPDLRLDLLDVQNAVVARRSRLMSGATARHLTDTRSLTESLCHPEELATMSALRRSTASLEQSELRAVTNREDAATVSWRRARIELLAGGALGLLVMSGAFFALRRDATARRRAETDLEVANSTLHEKVDALQVLSFELRAMARMGAYLHASLSTEELRQVLHAGLPGLFPGCDGAVYVFHSSHDVLERATSWGRGAFPPSFGPLDCWALRRGQAHVSDPGQAAVRCSHPGGENGATLCVPMAAAGEIMGVITIAIGNADACESSLDLATTVAGQVGLALSDLQLRDKLREQSIHDPLTGLFNRRYLEESFQLELHRAERSARPVSLIMLDLDHFKRLNDSLGHQAGDAVLQELGALLQRSVRAGDLACRYGGEEMLVLLPEVGISPALARAEELRLGISALRVRALGKALPTVTASFGVATFPHHGRTLTELLRSTDAALYRAKAAGRNRVVCAEPGAV